MSYHNIFDQKDHRYFLHNRGGVVGSWRRRTGGSRSGVLVGAGGEVGPEPTCTLHRYYIHAEFLTLIFLSISCARRFEALFCIASSYSTSTPRVWYTSGRTSIIANIRISIISFPCSSATISLRSKHF